VSCLFQHVGSYTAARKEGRAAKIDGVEEPAAQDLVNGVVTVYVFADYEIAVGGCA
jgi:hypothetical protein